MTQHALTPTITHRVRTFLQSQGTTLTPWSGLEETYAELYALLRRRRDDPSLWRPLTELLRDVVARVTHPEALDLPVAQAELLGSWDIDELVRRNAPEGVSVACVHPSASWMLPVAKQGFSLKMHHRCCPTKIRAVPAATTTASSRLWCCWPCRCTTPSA